MPLFLTYCIDSRESLDRLSKSKRQIERDEQWRHQRLATIDQNIQEAALRGINEKNNNLVEERKKKNGNLMEERKGTKK